MKKMVFLWVLFLFAVSLVLAVQGDNTQGTDGNADSQGEGGTGDDTGNDANAQDNASNSGQQVRDEQQTQNAGEETQLQQMLKVELKEGIQTKQNELSQELQTMKGAEQKVYQNQNEVRLAVHTLLEMESLTGGIGQQVKEVAVHFNNSVQATIKAEEKIQTRSAFSRFFAGGDEESSKELEQQVTQNQEKLRELEQLKEQCQCDEEVKTMMQEQIQNMEKEQIRLQDLAEKEKKSKGLLGWLWK